jgi:hypothetical protein
MSKPEVHQVSFTIHPCSQRLPAGQRGIGHYTVVDGVLTLTCPKGSIAIDETGKTYTHKLAPGDDVNEIATQLTMQLRSALRGKSAGPSNFNGPLNYPRSGIF